MSLEVIRQRQSIVSKILDLCFVQNNNYMVLRHTPSGRVEKSVLDNEEETYKLAIELIRTIKGHEKFLTIPGNQSNARVIGDITVTVPLKSMVTVAEEYVIDRMP